MTALELHTRLGRMIDEGHISENDEVIWSGTVGKREIKLPVTGLEAGSKEIPLHKVDVKSGNLVFGRVTP